MSWSPAADLLAVTAGATTVRSPSHIEVIDIRTGSHRTVTEPPAAHSGDWSPSFSPDGTRIAFIRSIAGSISDIFIVPAAGGTAHRVTSDNADVLGVDWEPDGRHLVFSSDRAGGISVWRVDTEGGHEPMLLAGGGAKLKHPTVARRTGTVAYEDWQYEINLREVPTVDDESHAIAALSPTSDRWNFHPQISPDGRRLVFQSTRSGQYELWISDRDGGNPRPLTRSGAYKSPARWAPDGRRIAFTMRTRGATEIAVLDVDDSAAQTVASEASAAVAPAWSADGTSIYYGSLRSGAWQIWNVDLSSARTRQVTNDGGYAALESSDGRWLYVARLDRPGLSKRPLAGGPETVVADHVLAEQWPNWGLYDGGLYYLAWPDDGDPCVALLDESGSTQGRNGPGSPQPRLLTRLPEYAWSGIAVTRDAARVIYAHADRRSSNIGALQIQR
jgi:Tol biopolymer transport system component